MKSKIFAVATFAFAAAFAISASANMMASDFGSSTLKKGSRGQSVTNLQTAMNACMSTTLLTDGIFGRGTDAAVKAFQSSKALVADGLVGMKSKAALADCGTTTTTTTTTTPVVTTSGTSGTLTNVNTVSGYSGLSLNAGQTDQKVLGAQFTATGSDMKIDRVTVDFKRTSTTGYYQLAQYISGVSVWSDAGRLATLPVSAASDITTTSPDTYEFNIAGLNYTVPAGTTGRIYVSVDVNATVDTSYASGNAWTVSIPANGLRAIEPSGYTSNYPGSSTLASNTFTVYNLSTSGNVQLRASIDATSPLAYGQQVNATTGNTSPVKLLAVSMYAKTGSDVTVRKFPISLTTTSSIDQVLNNVTLSNGTLSYTANIPATGCSTTTCTIVFGADSGVLNWKIPAGSTQIWTVSASVKPTSASFVEGSTLIASIKDSTNWIIDGADIQDSTGNPLSGSALTGGATGNPVGFFVNGVTITSTGTSATINPSLNTATQQTGTFTINFTVNALNSSVYIPKASPLGTGSTVATAGYVYYALTDLSNSNAIVSGSTASLTSSATVAGDTSTDYYVSAGSARTFTLTSGFTNTVASGHQFRLGLSNVNYSAVSGSAYSAYTLNLNNIYTNPLILN